jgi:hypothetical protein
MARPVFLTQGMHCLGALFQVHKAISHKFSGTEVAK